MLALSDGKTAEELTIDTFPDVLAEDAALESFLRDTPEEAALAFLGGTVARDPNNKCNACGFQSSCSLSGKGGCGRD